MSSCAAVTRGLDIAGPDHTPPPSCYGPLAIAPVEYVVCVDEEKERKNICCCFYHFSIINISHGLQQPMAELVAHVPLPIWREADSAFSVRPRIREEPASDSLVQRAVNNVSV